MTVYYNEFDPFAAQWLRNLILKGHLPGGDVDTRSITEAHPDDLRGYTQCHFLAGIGGWPYALQLAGWPEDAPVCTGSCPCQPFSEAGNKKAQADDRHLWPVWFRLIGEHQPSVIFGEQVDDAIALGWLDEVAHDMEAKGYAIASTILPACGVGAPHKRDRLFFVAHSSGANPRGRNADRRRGAQPQNLGQDWAYANWNGGQTSFGVLDDGVSGRVAKGIANGFGNAIVPQLAAQFVTAYMECRP